VLEHVEIAKTKKEDCVQEMESVTPTNETATNEVASTESDLQEQSGAEKAPVKEVKAAQIRRLAEGDLDAVVTVKVNGETKELTVREVMKLNQLENASQAKMREASELKSQVQQIMKLAKSDPKAFLRQTGIDPYDFAESTLAEKFELMQMSPEQKELMDLKNYKKSQEQREKEDLDAQEKHHMSRLESQEMETLDQEIGSALQEHGISDKYLASQVAARMLSASRQNKTLTAKQAAASVKQEYDSSILNVLSKMDAEAIHKALGKDKLKLLREYDVKRVSGNQTSQQSQSPGAKPASTAKKTFSNEHEWREHLSKMQANLRD